MRDGIILLIIGCLIILAGLPQLKNKNIYMEPSNLNNMLEFLIGGAIVVLIGLLKILNI